VSVLKLIPSQTVSFCQVTVTAFYAAILIQAFTTLCNSAVTLGTTFPR
jgi:hypothetical protein